MANKELNPLGELLNVGVMQIRPNGEIAHYTDKVLKLLSFTADEISEFKTLYNLVKSIALRTTYNSINASDIIEELFKTFASEAEQLSEGSHKSLSINYAVENGRILNVKTLISHDKSLLIVLADITENAVKEQSLQASLEMGNSGYFYISHTGKKIQYQSNYFDAYLTEAEKIRFEKEGVWAIIHPDDKDRVTTILKSMGQGGESKKLYLRCFLEKKGQIWFKCFFSPQSSVSGLVSGITCYFTDVTETLSIEGALRMSKKNLEKALQLKTDFISRVSHEVRTPMNAMVGIADALMNHHNDPLISPKLQLIQDSSVNILRILDETLDYAKLEADEIKIAPEVADPAIVVTRVCELWQEVARRKSVTLNYKIDKTVPSDIIFDAHRYEQCLNNLVSNAIKFAENGKVDVLLTRIQRGNAPAQLILAVKDNGIGMTPEQEKSLFEPFKQADSSIAKRFGGTGLGMKITRDIINLMGGKISAKTSPGHGTTFMIALPLITQSDTVQAESKPSTPKVQPAEPIQRTLSPSVSAALQSSLTQTSLTKSSLTKPSLTIASQTTTPLKQASEAKKKTLSSVQSLTAAMPVETPVLPEKPVVQQKSTGAADLAAHIMATAFKDPPKPPPSPYINLRVLVVDDNATNHLVVQSLLEGVVGTIYVANNGLEALDVLEVEDIDVVFMDIHMPVMDGIEATLAIRNSDKPWADVPIIALTADPLYQQKRLCMNIGMNYALAKPVKLTDLKEALEACYVIAPEDEKQNEKKTA